MKNFLLLFIAVIFSFSAFSKHVPEYSAKQVAENFIFEKTGIAQEKISFTEVFTKENNGIVLFYVFNYKNGFVIICADDIITPVLAYSTESNYSKKDMPPQLRALLENYQKQIEYSVKNKSESFLGIESVWEKYNTPSDKFIPTKNTKDVAPLLGTIEWHQNSGWNIYCPADAAGSGGYTYAGCVATATGQIMRYWNYPSTGTGSHSYTDDFYGLQTADFENTVIN